LKLIEEKDLRLSKVVFANEDIKRTQIDQFEEVVSFRIYNGDLRQKIMKFCGWTDHFKVLPRES